MYSEHLPHSKKENWKSRLQYFSEKTVLQRQISEWFIKAYALSVCKQDAVAVSVFVAVIVVFVVVAVVGSDGDGCGVTVAAAFYIICSTSTSYVNMIMFARMHTNYAYTYSYPIVVSIHSRTHAYNSRILYIQQDKKRKWTDDCFFPLCQGKKQRKKARNESHDVYNGVHCSMFFMRK